jgi:sulfite exporter TauE/SafE
MVLIVAAIGMTMVELARDSIAHLDVDLIPMVLVGLILVFVGLCYEIKGRSQSLSTASNFLSISLKYDPA